jgi:hypothetical protein
MSKTARWYVLLVVTALISGIYARLTLGWSDLECYGGAAALLVLIGGVGLPWMEYAPDGAFRRQPHA